MTRKRCAALMAGAALWVTVEVRGEFVPGHLYIGFSEVEACDFGGEEWIVELDPDTGKWSVFADSSEPICGASGLRFTPDDKHLLQLNAGFDFPPPPDLGWIRAYDGDGESEIILDASDGFSTPFGINGVAFDAVGNLFVVSADNSRIIKFSSDLHGPGEVFADFFDGVFGRGSLDFAPNGDLYYASAHSYEIIRITPDGEAFLFDTLPGVVTLAFDRSGNLFATHVNARLYVYVGGIAGNLVLLYDRFECCGQTTVAVTHDGRFAYVAQIMGLIHRYDVETGDVTLVADVSGVSGQGVFPVGIALFSPVIPGDLDGDGDVDLDDFGPFDECLQGSLDGEPLTPGCLPADIDDDADIDFADFAGFQVLFEGS